MVDREERFTSSGCLGDAPVDLILSLSISPAAAAPPRKTDPCTPPY